MNLPASLIAAKVLILANVSICQRNHNNTLELAKQI